MSHFDVNLIIILIFIKTLPSLNRIRLLGVKGFPIVFTLAVLNRRGHKERLVHSGRRGEAIAGFFQWAFFARAFRYVWHFVSVLYA